MTYQNTVILLIIFCLANALAYIVAEWRDWRTIRWITKMAASTAFVVLALVNGAADTHYGRFMLIALILSWVGDALLLSLRNAFLLSGIAAFLLAHAAFGGSFATQPLDATRLAIALAILTVVAAAFLRWLWKYLSPFYRIAVPIYLAAITIMTSIAISVSAAAFAPLLGIAAIAFAVSDVSVALNRFVERKISNKVWGLPPVLFCPDSFRNVRALFQVMQYSCFDRPSILVILTLENFRMKIISLIVLSVLVHVSVPAQRTSNYLRYVNPLIGTQKMGHTFPGATVPFGSVQLSPDTDQQPHNIGGKYNKDAYKYCAGYQYDDSSIVGFSHTHFSGTGHSDLGDFLIMPTAGELQLEPGTKEDTRTGFRSKFSHANETAEAGYYKVLLEDDDILAEMTATTRVGFHQYTFTKSEETHIILDMMHGIYNYDDKNVWTFVRVENDHTIVGYRQTNGWARTRTVYFAMEFSRPFKSYGFKNFGKEDYKGFWRKFDQTKNFPEMAGKQIRAYFDFDAAANEKVKIKFAISPVSTDGAKLNLRSEIPHWDFERTKREAHATWNKELSKIAVTTLDEGEMINFYTALYHALLTPTVYMDVNGRYKGIDQNVHQVGLRPAREQGRNAQRSDYALANAQASAFTNYTTFSLWDTYRALHPLLNIIQPARNRDMVRSMMAHYDQSVHKMLPVWSHYANENWCMIGYHSVSVIADAIVKGNFTGLEAMKALEASAQTARTKYYDGLEYYMKLGYVPEDKNSSSVSKTLEYAYDDWCIAQAARKLNRVDLAHEFTKRSENWRNVYDASTGFMRPKMSDGKFREKFDVLSTHDQGFIEGNAWNYSLYVPHDPEAMIKLMGGKEKFSKHMDELFTMHLPDEFFAETEDITREGIIGNYVHGNEPAHHAAYLYNWTDAPWKTQERVRMILTNQYKPTPDGLGGNDDCGQMSAWYLFSALGFYPVAPGSDQYALGSPVIKTAVLRLENGKTLSIEAAGQSEKNVYVTRVVVNGGTIKGNSITHAQIMNGGKIVFHMADKRGK